MFCFTLTLHFFYVIITKTRPSNILQLFTVVKKDNFQMKKCDICLIVAQNIDCGYRLEPPYIEAVLTSTHNLCFRAKIRKNVYPCRLHFYYIKVGFKGVNIARTCLHDVTWRQTLPTDTCVACKTCSMSVASVNFGIEN